MEPYTIYRHPQVQFDLYEMADLIIEFAGKAAAINKLNEVEATLKQLANTPHISSIRDDIYPGLCAIPAAGKGVICFVVDDDQCAVFILCIAYACADWMRKVALRE